MILLRRVWNWLSLEGRAGRREYNLVLWPMAAGFPALIFRDMRVRNSDGWISLGDGLFMVGGFMLLAFFGMVVTARRLHDIGHSAAWIFIFMFVLKLVYALYERMPLGLLRDVVLGVPLACGAAVLIFLAIKRGEPDTNVFGPPSGRGQTRHDACGRRS